MFLRAREWRTRARLPFFEIARVLVRFDHIVSLIVNAHVNGSKTLRSRLGLFEFGDKLLNLLRVLTSF
jgi:hypothetical protein